MKQRLIGTIVLGCLALIFIPVLLDGEGVQDPAPVSISAPPRPDTTIIPLPEPVRPVILSDTDALDITNTTVTNPGTATQVTVTEPDPTVDAEPASATDVVPPAVEQEPVIPETEPRLTTQGIPEGWSVKLGTFSDRSNAESLVASLILENYKAYSRPVQSGTQTMLAVYVGPVLTQPEATSLQQELKANAQFKDAVVVKFTIDTPVQGQ